MKRPKTKLVPLALIDEPPIAMRSTMDDVRLNELAESIKRDGLVNPISVTLQGARYQIEAGHRRFVACQRAGLTDVEVRDFTGTGVSGEAVKCAENLYREDVNDADMADYLYDLQEKEHYTLEQFKAITGKSETWIASRLGLYRGDKRVFDALRAGEIKLSIAELLNKFPDDYRLMYLQNCIQQTPPARVVEQWLRDVKQIVMSAVPTPAGVIAEVPAAPLPGMEVHKCGLCDQENRPWDMEFIRVHKDCLKSILQAIQNAEMQQ